MRPSLPTEVVSSYAVLCSSQAVEGTWFAKLMLLVLLSKARRLFHLVLRVCVAVEGPGAQPARHPSCRRHGLVTTREPLAPRLKFAMNAR